MKRLLHKGNIVALLLLLCMPLLRGNRLLLKISEGDCYLHNMKVQQLVTEAGYRNVGFILMSSGRNSSPEVLHKMGLDTQLCSVRYETREPFSNADWGALSYIYLVSSAGECFFSVPLHESPAYYPLLRYYFSAPHPQQIRKVQVPDSIGFSSLVAIYPLSGTRFLFFDEARDLSFLYDLQYDTFFQVVRYTDLERYVGIDSTVAKLPAFMKSFLRARARCTGMYGDIQINLIEIPVVHGKQSETGKSYSLQIIYPPGKSVFVPIKKPAGIDFGTGYILADSTQVLLPVYNFYRTEDNIKYARFTFRKNRLVYRKTEKKFNYVLSPYNSASASFGAAKGLPDVLFYPFSPYIYERSGVQHVEELDTLLQATVSKNFNVNYRYRLIGVIRNNVLLELLVQDNNGKLFLYVYNTARKELYSPRSVDYPLSDHTRRTVSLIGWDTILFVDYDAMTLNFLDVNGRQR